MLQFNLTKYLLVFFVLGQFGGTVFAQNSQNQLEVTVIDVFKDLIENAKVTIFSKTFNKTIITNQNGISKFEGLVEGEYFLTITAEGFTEYKVSAITLKKNEVKRLETILEVKPIEENVVIDNKTEEKYDFGNTKIFTKDEIEKLPNDAEELKKRLFQIAGGNLPILVNGSEDSQIPNKEDIKSITIYRELFSAQFEGTSGERIEIQTKDSRKRFGGNFSLKFADSSLNAKNPFINEKLPFQNKEFSVYLYGPITNKISWSTYSEIKEFKSSSAINAIILNSVFQPIAYKSFQITPRNQKNLGLTIDSAPTEKSTFNIRYFYSTNLNKNLGVGGFSLPSRVFDSETNSHGLRFNSTYVFNSNIFNVIKGSIDFSKNRTLSSGNQIGVNVLDSFFEGSSGLNRNLDTSRVELFDDFSITKHRIRLGFGMMLRKTQNQEDSIISNATYYFNGRNAPMLDSNHNPITNSNGDLIIENISSIESYRRTLIFLQLGLSPLQIRNLGGGATQLSISDGQTNIKANQTDFASYVQLSYGLSDTVSTSFGLRYENQTNIKSHLDLAPRFGIIWSPKNEKKLSPLLTLPKISAGFGWFYSRFGIENLFNSKRTTDSNVSNYTINNSILLDSFPNLPLLQNIQQLDFSKSTLTIKKNLKTPSQTIFNLILDKRLSKIFSTSFRYTKTSSSRQVITRNINAPLPNTFSELFPNDAVYPFKNKQPIYEISSQGKSDSKRYNLSLMASQIPLLKKKVSFGLNYAFNQAKSNLVSGNSNYLDAYDFSQEYTPTILDGVHNISTWFETTLPKSINLYLVSTYRSGLRFNITTGRDFNGDGYYSERPAFANDLSKSGIIHTKYGIFDPNPSLTDLIIPRNFGRGPSFVEVNLTLTKSFKFFVDKNTKEAKFSARLNVFVNNLFNVTNLGSPIGNITSPNFLRSLSSNSINGVGLLSEPRSINFAFVISK